MGCMWSYLSTRSQVVLSLWNEPAEIESITSLISNVPCKSIFYMLKENSNHHRVSLYAFTPDAKLVNTASIVVLCYRWIPSFQKKPVSIHLSLSICNLITPVGINFALLVLNLLDHHGFLIPHDNGFVQGWIANITIWHLVWHIGCKLINNLRTKLHYKLKLGALMHRLQYFLNLNANLS